MRYGSTDLQTELSRTVLGKPRVNMLANETLLDGEIHPKCFAGEKSEK